MPVLEIRLPAPSAALDAAATALLAGLAGDAAVQRRADHGASPTEMTRDLNTALASAALVLAIPGAVLASHQLWDHWTRPTVAPLVVPVIEALKDDGGTARITLPDGTVVEMTATTRPDTVVDAILKAKPP